jgi:hypothetical protein
MDPLSLAGFATSAIGGLFSGFAARKQARALSGKADYYAGEVKRLESSRQEIIDPYANITDLSGMISNPYQNLQVATKAAEMQAAETDLSLAATLDTLRATGAGAGGATALAQAAARSKQGIAASIEQQEAQNARLRAQGESQMQQMRMNEAIRQQQADVSGQQFMFGARETREMQQLDRAQALQNQYAMAGAQMKQASAQAFGSALGGLTAFTAGGGFKAESWNG